jgi:hypothetical protein
VTIQGLASSVVAHGGARVSVAGCFLDVPKLDSGVECSGDECVSQRVGSDALGDPGLSGGATHDPAGGVTVESFAVAVDEDRTLETLTDREVERPGDPRRERHRDDLATLSGHPQGPVASFEAEVPIRAARSCRNAFVRSRRSVRAAVARNVEYVAPMGPLSE